MLLLIIVYVLLIVVVKTNLLHTKAWMHKQAQHIELTTLR